MRITLSASVLFFAALSAARAQAPDYRTPGAWLCRPGRNDSCAADLTASVIAADGTITIERSTAAPNPPIDCFYVYPTVSNDTTMNSDVAVGPDEQDAAALQFARFGAACRLYAPLYRQQTLKGMRVMLAGGTMAFVDTAYADVRAAWDHYIEHDNKGRGVVLIGHSQGSRMLISLLRERIDGQAVSKRLVSALIAGLAVGVTPGRENGGTFRALPLCREAASTGCIVAWASFREGMAPARNSLYGRIGEKGQVPACVNPAALLGRPTVHTYLPARSGAGILRAGRPHSWFAHSPAIETAFVSLPGKLEATCVQRDGAHVLSVRVRETGATAPSYVMGGDILTNGTPDPFWGLHLLDISLVQGDLIELVQRQSTAYQRKR